MLVNLAWAGLTAEIFQLLVVSIARYNYGASQIGNSHYAYINIVLLSPAIALVVTRLVLWSPAPRPVLATVLGVVFVAYALTGVTAIKKWQQDFQYVTGNSQQLALGIKQALKDGQDPLTESNPDSFNSGLAPKYIGIPRIMNALGSHQPTPVGRLTADTTFFTAVDEEDHGLARPPVDLVSDGFDRLKDEAGCQSIEPTEKSPQLILTTGSEGNEIVVWSNSTKVAVHLERDDAVGPQRDFTVDPGPVHIATTAKNVELYVAFNGSGPFNVCQG